MVWRVRNLLVAARGCVPGCHVFGGYFSLEAGPDESRIGAILRQPCSGQVVESWVLAAAPDVGRILWRVFV